MSDFKIIGFTDKVNECDCCGRTELKGTYCISIEGSEFYYGSSCATKKGADKVVLKKELTSYETAVKWVNQVIRRRLKGDRTDYSNMLNWALIEDNKRKSFNSYFELNKI